MELETCGQRVSENFMSLARKRHDPLNESSISKRLDSKEHPRKHRRVFCCKLNTLQIRIIRWVKISIHNSEQPKIQV